jgi:hypothetical protein
MTLSAVHTVYEMVWRDPLSAVEHSKAKLCSALEAVPVDLHSSRRIYQAYSGRVRLRSFPQSLESSLNFLVVNFGR